MIMMNGFTLGFFFPKQPRTLNTTTDQPQDQPTETDRRNVETATRDATDGEAQHASQITPLHRRF